MAKTKLKLADLAPKPYTFELEHPAHGNIGATITMVGPDSMEFITSSAKMAKESGALKVDELQAEDILKYTASLYTPLIKAWDEDVFGEYSKENVAEVLSDVQNQWIMKQIEEVFQDRKFFFVK